MSNKNLLHIRSSWKRFFLDFYLSWLIFLGEFQSARARIHWIGRQRRPRRPERLLIFFLTFGAMALLEPEEYIYWSILWGGSVSIFLNIHAVYRLIPHKRFHWVGK